MTFWGFWGFWDIDIHYRVDNCWPSLVKALIRDLGPSLGFHPPTIPRHAFAFRENYFQLTVRQHGCQQVSLSVRCQKQAFNPNAGDKRQSGILFNSIYSVDKANSSIKWQVGNRNKAISPTKQYVERLMKQSLSGRWADDPINRLEARGKGKTPLSAFLLTALCQFCFPHLLLNWSEHSH